MTDKAGEATSGTSIELIKLLWEEFKYRHELFWRLFFSFSLAILFLLALPYAYAENVKVFKKLLIFLPVAACTVTVFSYWVLCAEYQRLVATRKQFNDVLPEQFKEYPLNDQVKFSKLLNKPVGWVVVNAFLICFLFLAILDAYFLLCFM
ncbi:MAG: hypothetical protein R2684_12940 [Pyrinomonadaceae bacterium]